MALYSAASSGRHFRPKSRSLLHPRRRATLGALLLAQIIGFLSFMMVLDTRTADARETPVAGAVRTALFQQGVPYLWGGNPTAWSLQGAKATKCGPDRKCRFDCSSLVQYSFQRNGIKAPRTTGELWNAGKRLKRDQARVGDLVFYSDNKLTVAGIYHVGILVGNGKMVEAPRAGKNVRVANYRDRPGLMPYVVRLG